MNNNVLYWLECTKICLCCFFAIACLMVLAYMFSE